MKVTVYNKQTGKASRHWPIDAQEILERDPSYTLDPEQVEGDLDDTQARASISREDAVQLRALEAKYAADEAAAQVAEESEAEAEALQELGEIEAESGEPTTPQLMPSHFLDEEQAGYPSDWKYRRHHVSAANPAPTAQIRKRPHVSTVHSSDAEVRYQRATQDLESAQADIQAAGGEQEKAKSNKTAVAERKKQLEEQKKAAEAAREERRKQRQQERETRQQAREEANQAQEEGSQPKSRRRSRKSSSESSGETQS